MNMTDHYNNIYETTTTKEENTNIERRPSLLAADRTLYPPVASFQPLRHHHALHHHHHHPYSLDNSNHSSPSNSRRGSLTDPALHVSFSNRSNTLLSSSFNSNSPPSSPSSSSRRSSMVTTPPEHLINTSTPPPPLINSNSNSPWRRESLPSISHLTTAVAAAAVAPNKTQPLPPPPNVTAATAASDFHFKHVNRLMDDGVPTARRHSIATLSRKSRQNSISRNIPYEQDEEDMMMEDDHMQQQRSTSRRGSEQTPYSRSPELRISHKLAERKRRKEMKDLFDDLRDLLPVDKGLKTSKWEILSKTLEYIRILHERENLMEREKQELLNELNSLKR